MIGNYPLVAVVNRPNEAVLAGDARRIIDVYTQLSPAYKAEFTFANGFPRVEDAFERDEIRHLDPLDVLTIRQHF